jgi:phytepsin
MLAIGELPEGVNSDNLTWVNLRGYPSQLTPPDPNELYPLAWEVPLDDVYLDGQKLPRSTLSPSDISLTALVDTVGHPHNRHLVV